MAYTKKEKSTGLDTLTNTTLAQGDLHIVGDVSDSGRAKAVTQDELEDYIANSTNFITNLTNNITFQGAAAPLTTKGDLYTRNASTNTRLGVGTNGKVLTADSTQTTGLKWADVTGGSGGGGGGTKLAIDTTTFTQAQNTIEQIAYTISIPAGTLGTNNGIKISIPVSNFRLNTSISNSIRLKFGGTTINTLLPYATAGVFAKGIINFIVLANNSSLAQKIYAQFTPDTSQVIARVDSTSTIDTSVSLNMEITLQASSLGFDFTAESIIVEKISSVQDGIFITATADENLTIGTSVGVSNDSTGIKVSRANRLFATSNDFDFTNTLSIGRYTSCSIGGDKFIQLGYNAADTTIRASVTTVNTATNSVTVGASAVCITTTLQVVTCCQLATDKFIVFYTKSGGGNTIFAKVGTVSGSTITFGTEQTITTPGGPTLSVTCAFSSTDKAIVVAVTSNGPNDTIATPLTVSGTTVTAGTPLTMSVTMRNTTQVVNIGTDKFLFANNSYAEVGTVSANVLTVGTEVQFETFSTTFQSIVSPNTNVAVFSYTTSSDITLACTISGLVPTFGNKLVAGGTAAVETTTSIVALSYGAGFVTNTLTRITLSGNTSTLGAVVRQSNHAASFYIQLTGYYVGISNPSNYTAISLASMSNNYVGFAQATASKGATISVLVQGVDANQTGLIVGGKYLVSNGTLTFAASNRTITTLLDTDVVLALSATQVKV